MWCWDYKWLCYSLQDSGSMCLKAKLTIDKKASESLLLGRQKGENKTSKNNSEKPEYLQLYNLSVSFRLIFPENHLPSQRKCTECNWDSSYWPWLPRHLCLCIFNLFFFLIFKKGTSHNGEICGSNAQKNLHVSNKIFQALSDNTFFIILGIY